MSPETDTRQKTLSLKSFTHTLMFAIKMKKMDFRKQKFHYHTHYQHVAKYLVSIDLCINSKDILLESFKTVRVTIYNVI